MTPPVDGSTTPPETPDCPNAPACAHCICSEKERSWWADRERGAAPPEQPEGPRQRWICVCGTPASWAYLVGRNIHMWCDNCGRADLNGDDDWRPVR